MGAHVYWPWFLEHNWFPKFRLSGWSPDWYAGFPVGHTTSRCRRSWSRSSTSPVSVQRRVQARHRQRAGAVAGRRLLFATGCGPVAGAARVRDRRARHARGDPQRLADLRRQHRQHARGEFSFTLALALGLFALGARVDARYGQAAVAAALLIAAAVMSHVVVAIFVLVAVLLLGWSPPVADVAARGAGRRRRRALTAVWTLPLLARQGYTQSMRYDEGRPGSWSCEAPRCCGFRSRARCGTRSKACGTRFLGRPPARHQRESRPSLPPTLWLPWWIWVLAGDRDRRRRLVPPPLDARAARRSRWSSACSSSSGPSTRCGICGSCRSGCSRGRSSPRWARPTSCACPRSSCAVPTRGFATVTCRTRGPWRGLTIATADDAAADPAEAEGGVAQLAEPPLRPWSRRDGSRRTRLRPCRSTRRAAGSGRSRWPRWSSSPASGRCTGASNASGTTRHRDRGRGRAWNYPGYERARVPAVPRDHGDDGHATARSRAVGAVVGADARPINSYGTSLALELLPYFTHGKHRLDGGHLLRVVGARRRTTSSRSASSRRLPRTPCAASSTASPARLRLA